MLIIYRGYELTNDRAGWWVWQKDKRLIDRPLMSEQQAKVWIDRRETEEVQRRADLNPR